MSNHLGNVLTVINDVKVPYLEQDNLLFKATIMRTYDYSPFGVQLDGRSAEREFCETITTNVSGTDLDNNFNDGTLQGWSPINGQGYETDLWNPSNQLRIRRLTGDNSNQFGAMKEMPLTEGFEYTFSATVDRNNCDGHTIRVRILDPSGTEIHNSEINPTGITNFSHTFTAQTTGNYTFIFDRINSTTNCNFRVDNVLLTYTGTVTTMVNCFGADGYRYGYQGSEKDDEVKGSGNSYTTEFRLLDPRLGRWLSTDPEEKQFPSLNPFNSMENNPIELNDPNGDCPNCVTAGVGAAVGFFVELGSQIVGNVVSGNSWYDIDVADLALSTAEGAMIGFAGPGASVMIRTTATGMAVASPVVQASVDVKPFTKDQPAVRTVFSDGENNKSLQDAVIELAFSSIGKATAPKPKPTSDGLISVPSIKDPVKKAREVEAAKPKDQRNHVTTERRLEIEKKAKADKVDKRLANGVINTLPEGMIGGMLNRAQSEAAKKMANSQNSSKPKT